MFEPNALSIEDLSRGIVWASSLNMVQEDKNILLSALNATKRDVFVRKDISIGSLCYAEEATSNEEELFNEFDNERENIKMNVGKIKIGENLKKSERNEIFLLLEKYKHVFQWSEFGYSRTNPLNTKSTQEMLHR